MADDPYILDLLELSGFRAFLEPQQLEFGTKSCLAVFAPNAKGKSSIVDALEFMFSEDGTLEKLGLRAINNQAGITALAHNMAGDRNIEPFVRVRFKHGRQKTDALRIASGSERPMPEIAATVKACFNVDPLIRGYSLRQFVEDETAEERYANVARWLQLGPLVDVQKNLRNLRRRVKEAAEDSNALNRVNTDLKKKTANAVTTWDDEDVLLYANNILAQLDKVLVLKSLDRKDPAHITVQERAKSEEVQLGLEGVRQLRRSAASLYEEKEDPDTRNVTKAGHVHNLETAIDELAAAKKAEATERQAAANAAFEELWKAAEPLFAEGREPQIDSCPICKTPIADSIAGSVQGVRQHIAVHLTELTAYANAKRKLKAASTSVENNSTKVTIALGTLEPLLGEKYPELRAATTAYNNALTSWKGGLAPDGSALKTAVLELLNALDKRITQAEAKQREQTYRNVLAKFHELMDLKDEREDAIRLLGELKKLSTALDEQAADVSSAIRDKVQKLLDTLRDPVYDIYKQIQGGEAPAIRLELPSEKDITQQRLNLVIDFAANRLGVQPIGYLSDSQIHSLALALRLAAIKRFNSATPFLALDDIVTSYDADHRRTIAAMLAKEFTDFQLIITTHDERFFIYLKDQLSSSQWQYKRIIRLDSDFGPRFVDHKITEEMIEARWNAGESAANEMRQAEEEWLLGLSRDFVVDVRIRPVERAHSYERSELAEAIGGFLTKRKVLPPLVPGVNNQFIASLQRGEIENFGSHFQDGPYGDGSEGDERARWNEFKAFRSLFVCPKCRGIRFKRPRGMRMAVCRKDNCETPFSFD